MWIQGFSNSYWLGGKYKSLHKGAPAYPHGPEQSRFPSPLLGIWEGNFAFYFFAAPLEISSLHLKWGERSITAAYKSPPPIQTYTAEGNVSPALQGKDIEGWIVLSVTTPVQLHWENLAHWLVSGNEGVAVMQKENKLGTKVIIDRSIQVHN